MSDKSDIDIFNESYDQRKIKNIQFESIKQTKEFKDYLIKRIGLGEIFMEILIFISLFYFLHYFSLKLS